MATTADGRAEETARQALDDAFPPRVKDRLGLNREEYQRLIRSVAAAVAQAVEAERERCIEDIQEHRCIGYSENCDCQSRIIKAITLRAEAEGGR